MTQEEDNNKKQSSSFSIPSLSSIVSTLQTLQNEIRKNIIFIRESQEKANSYVAPIYTPRETFCKVVLEPLYKTSCDFNESYPYLSMLARSQPGLIMGTAISTVAIPTIAIRRKSLMFMTLSTTAIVGGVIGLVHVKWMKDH